MEPLSRMTQATRDVLTVLLDGAAAADRDGHSGDGVWGMLVIKRTGRPAGSVYPILERLEGAGWITSRWEDDSDRAGPRRRLYELTPGGADAAGAAVAHTATARAARTVHA